MSPPGDKAGIHIDDKMARELFQLAKAVICRLGVYGERARDLAQDVMSDLGEALALGAIRSLDGAVLASWVLTCASRKTFRFRDARKREREFEPDELPLVVDGFAVILARAELRRIPKETILEIIDYEFDETLNKKEQRRARYIRERAQLKAKVRKKPIKKKKKRPRRT